jgi:hypothetical protein
MAPVRTTTTTGIARLDALLAIVNAGLLLALLIVFFKQWRRTKASFALGLVVFAAVLLVRELLGVLNAVGRAGGLPIVGPGFDLLLTVGEGIALAILLYLVVQ